MPWLRLDDVGYDDVLVRAVGNAAYGAVTRMGQYCSAQRTDGWIPADKAREIASRAELRALETVRVADLGPMLHAHGAECRCLTDKAWSAEQGGYYLHGFLDKNPSKSENDVQKAKKRETRDPQLKLAVKSRDGDQCRYCGITVRWADRKTPAGGVLDHVDPRIAAGADNLVVACRGCNSRKQDCTPEAAGMALLPVPTEAPTITDGSRSDQRPINDRSMDRSLIGTPPEPRPDSGPAPDPHPAQRAPERASLSENPQVTPQNSKINGDITDGTTVGTGRGRDGTGTAVDTGTRSLVGDAGPNGYRPTVGPATTPRGHLTPNPYLKSATGQTSPPDPNTPSDADVYAEYLAEDPATGGDPP